MLYNFAIKYHAIGVRVDTKEKFIQLHMSSILASYSNNIRTLHTYFIALFIIIFHNVFNV